MKKTIVVLMLTLVALTFTAKAFAEPGSVDMGRPMMGAGGMSMMDPATVAGYDEKTMAIWEKMADNRLKMSVNGLIAIGVGLAIGLAAFGGGLGQGRLAAAAVEGVARNPETNSKIFTMLIISMALIESLVIYALVIAFILQGKM